MRDDFYNDDKLLDKYQRKMAQKVSKQYGISYDDALRGYKSYDFDQGDDNTFDAYLRDTGKFKSYYDGASKASHEYYKARKEAVKSYLGELGDMQVKEVAYKATIGKRVVQNTTMSDIFEAALTYRSFDD